MGLLDYIQEKGKGLLAGGAKPRAIAAGLLGGDTAALKGAWSEIKQLGDPEYMRNIKQISKDEAMNIALDANPVMGAITAYHGSPYLFDKFSVEKAGTGSGKNLFGEGVYTAELAKEAKGYMTAGNSGTINYNGKLMSRDSARNSKDAAAYALYLAKGNVDDAIRSGLSTPEAISKIKYEKIQPNGNLYKVDIPDELIPSMINYGDSIGSQHKSVIDLADKNKDALNKILEIEKIKNPDANLNSIYDLSSSKLFRALGGVGNAEKAMLSNGINGVRYNSPVEGMNTVVFDPSVIKILERNGQPFSLLGGAQ